MTEYSYGGDTPAFLHILDGFDLKPITRIPVIDPATEVRSLPGGRRLLVAQGNSQPETGCCALYVVDLVAETSCYLHEPVADFAVSADGLRAYSQRGNTPIAIYDLETLERVAQVPADGHTFSLSASPDGRWLAAASRFSLDGKPTLRFIDVEAAEVAGSVPYKVGAGAWLDGQYRALILEDDSWQFLTVSPPAAVIESQHELSDFGVTLPVDVRVQLLPVDGGLALHVPISDWIILGGRGHLPSGAPGGIFILDGAPGAEATHLMPEEDFGVVDVSQDGSALYALIASADDPQVLAIDAGTGDVIAERDLTTLGPGRWNLDAAELSPSALDATGDLGPCESTAAEVTAAPDATGEAIWGPAPRRVAHGAAGMEDAH